VVKYKLTGEQAIAFLELSKKSHVAKVVDDTPSLTFVVRSLSDVKAVAHYLGVDIPEGRGRFPIVRLENEIARLGHKLDRSDYGESDVSPATYRVSLMELVDDTVYPRTGMITGDQLREFTTGKRGRVSKETLATAAINVHGWSDTYLADSVVVERQD
jgi:phytoene dehydrogenase-like protein